MAAIDNQFLIEFESRDAAGTVTTQRFATGVGFMTGASDTPSLTKYPARVKDAGNVETYLYGSGRTYGASSLGAGRVLLLNGDRELDYLQDLGLDGGTITIRERTGNSYPDDFPVRFTGSINYGLVSTLDVSLDIKSPTVNIRTLAYQPIKYAGTNNGSSIYLEGTADDIIGQPKPKVRGGTVFNMEAILVDRANEIYQVSSDPIRELPNVYVGRAVIPVDTVHTTLSAFVTSATGGSVTAGEYSVYFGDPTAAEGTNERGCYIAFGTTPTKRVTVDAIEGWENLLTYSNTFTDASWTKTNVTATGSAATSPAGSGSTQASSLLETVTNGVHEIEHAATIASGGLYSASWYVEPVGRTRLRITVGDATYANGFYVNATLTGAGSVTTAVVGAGSNVSATVALSEEGFYRVTVSGRVNNSVTAAKVKLAIADDSGTLSYAGTITKGFNIWEAQLEYGPLVTPPSNTSGSTYLKNSFGQLAFRILAEKDYVLDPISVYLLDLKRKPAMQDFRKGEVKVGNVLDELAVGTHGYLVGTVLGTFEVGMLELPTLGELDYTVDNRILLGEPKIKVIDNNDEDRGIPSYRVNVSYAENYTVMSEADIFGVAELTDIPFISNRFRVAPFENATIRLKHLNSPEKNLETKLVLEADADSFAQYEQEMYEEYRPIVQVRIPREFGASLNYGSVIRLEDKLYRIIGKGNRFPASGLGSLSTQALTFQAWGGVPV